MKNFKKPFIRSAYERLAESFVEYDRLIKQYHDLEYIRDTVNKNGMTEALYDFINADGSLERLFVGLPKATSEVACEGLNTMQVAFIESSMEDLKKTIKDLVAHIWEIFHEWLMDYWDRNRKIRIELKKQRALFSANPAAFGDPLSFDTVRGPFYTYADWEKMCSAASSLTRIIQSIPNTGIKDWVIKTVPQVNDNLAEFGKYVDDKFVMHDGTPKYDRNIITMSAGRWKFQGIGRYLDRAIDLLSNEIEHRKEFEKMKYIFTAGDPLESRSYFFTKFLVVRTKEQVLHLARSIKFLLNRAIQSKNRKYTIPT